MKPPSCESGSEPEGHMYSKYTPTQNKSQMKKQKEIKIGNCQGSGVMSKHIWHFLVVLVNVYKNAKKHTRGA